MKKTYRLFSLILAVLLVGCLPVYGGAETTEPTKITYWTFDSLQVPLMELANQAWNEAHPDQLIDIEITCYPGEELHNKLQIALQSGVGAPDMADIESSRFQSFIQGEPPFIALNSIVEPELENIVQSRVDMYAKNGNYYGIDTHVGAAVMWYNTEILEKAGVDYHEIVTWDDFMTAGKKVKETTGCYMTTWETSDTHSFLPLVTQQGGNLLNADDTFNLDSPEVVKALKFIQETIQEEIACVCPGSYHHAEEYFAFMNEGKAASVGMPVWYSGNFVKYMADLEDKIACAPVPVFEVGEKRSVGIGGTATTITNQCNNVELCLDILNEYKLSDEGCRRFWTDLGVDPIKTSLWSDPSLTEADVPYNTFFVKGTIWETLLDVKDEIAMQIYTPKYSAVFASVSSNVLYRCLELMEDPAQVVKEEQDQLISEWID